MTYNKVERRKIEEMNQFRFYIYIWKCHKKILCVAILNKQKCHFFSFTKSVTRRPEQGPVCRTVDTSGSGEKVEKGYGRVNIVHILCTHVCKWKKWYLLKVFQEW
jgi:hypothetical protein